MSTVVDGLTLPEVAAKATQGRWVQHMERDGELLADGTGGMDDEESPTRTVLIVAEDGTPLGDVDCRHQRDARFIARLADAYVTGEVVERPPEVRETCREESDEPGGGRCGKPAEFLLWGKLFLSTQLGPRCYDHAVAHTDQHMPSRVDQYAVLDLRGLTRTPRSR